MINPLFLSEQHPASRRHAILEDNALTLWLYITDTDSVCPVSDVWVFNRVPPPASHVRDFAPSPPPAPLEYVDASSLIADPHSFKWSFIWSPDGHAVALVKDGERVAFVHASQKPGFSRQVSRDGPWGYVWSDKAYEELFSRM